MSGAAEARTLSVSPGGVPTAAVVERHGDRHPLDRAGRNVCAEVLHHAIKDLMETPGRKNASMSDGRRALLAIDAALFLAGRHGTWWFDTLGLEQRAVLQQVGYAERVRELLTDGGGLGRAVRRTATLAQRRFMEQAVDELANGRAG